ncbi:PREDICTED: uncharacterized protein LOC104792316 [Camelina sativa]|uniref:Uncharacterized protein LOC104792316 n=1 Tax=Camelina sativa TaxID=90675 RepID=A0ABM1RTY6_CAMSA|nr:PREDICTED: uncharacterized protein LOC104792316 [Camelina sativa]
MQFMARCEEHRKNSLAGFLAMHKEVFMNQSQPIKTVVNSSIGCLGGAVFGYTLATLLPQITTHSHTLVGVPWVQAQAFAGVAGVYCAISGLIEGIRGKESLLSAMVPAAGSGAAYSFLSRDWQGRPINLLYTAIGFTVYQGLLYCLSDVIISNPKYRQTRSLLNKLELEKYEKEFKKANLTDSTLMLLTNGYLSKLLVFLYVAIRLIQFA